MLPMSVQVGGGTLVGRHEEISAVDTHVDALDRDHAGGMLLISGEAGVGKSRLIEALVEMASERGFHVLTGGCVQFGESVLPAAPVVEMLRGMERTLDESEAQTIMGSAQDVLTDSPRAEGDARAPRLAESLHGVVTRLATRHPVVMVFEDLHWADRTTRDLLGFLATSLKTEPVLIVGTYRSDDLHRLHPLIATLAELQRAVRPQRLELQAFDLEATADLLNDIGGQDLSQAEIEEMHRRSGGNAFYLEELLVSAGGSGVPGTLREVVLSRTQGLGQDALLVLRLASIVGANIDEALLAAVADLEPAATNAALHELVDHHFLVHDERGFRFRHELTREVFAAELLPGERAGLHVQLARELEQTHPERVGEIAHNWYESGAQPEALGSALVAAKAAHERGTHAEALLHYQRALELWDRVPPPERPDDVELAELLLEAAAAAADAKDGVRAVEFGRRACGELEGGDMEAFADGLQRLARWQYDAGDPAAPETLERLVGLIEDLPPSAVMARVMALAAGTDMGTNDARGFVRAERAIEIATQFGEIAAQVHALNTRGVCRFNLGDMAGLDDLEASTELARQLDNLDGVMRGYINRVWCLYTAGRHKEAIEMAEEGLHDAAEHGYWAVCGSLLGENASHALETLGRWDELDELADYVLKCRPLELEVPSPTGMQVFARVMVKQGQTDRARPILEHDLEAQLSGYFCGLPYVLVGMLEMDLLEGRSSPDREMLRAAWEFIPRDGLHAFAETMAMALRYEAEVATRARYKGDDQQVAEAQEAADVWLGHVERIAAGAADALVDPDFDTLVEQCHAEHDRAHNRNNFERWAASSEAGSSSGDPGLPRMRSIAMSRRFFMHPTPGVARVLSRKSTCGMPTSWRQLSTPSRCWPTSRISPAERGSTWRRQPPILLTRSSDLHPST